MAFIQPYLRLLVLTWISWHTLASQISFNSSSSLIQPLLTSTFTLRCSFRDTASSSNLIGKKRSLTSSPTNAKFVTSIFIFKDGVDLASVSEHIPARPVLQNAAFDVSGSIPGTTSGERGYIELTWMYPEATVGGNFTCQVGAVDDVGHPVTFAESMDVDVVMPSLEDVVHHLVQEDRLNKAEISRNRADITNLTQQLTEARHIEHGVILCHSDNDVNIVDGENVTKSASFQNPYKSVPEVVLSLKEYDSSKNHNAWFDIKLLHTDTLGFTVSCKAWDTALVGGLEVTWISLP